MPTNSWNKKTRMQLIEYLATYTAAGIPISAALRVISEKLSKSRQKSLARVIRCVDEGQPLSKAFMSEIRPPPAIVGLISCGESTGTLAQALRSAHILLEREDELRKKILSSMTYPVVIGLATVTLTLGLVRGVMPQIVPLLLSLHTKLPLITVLVMNVSDFLAKFSWFVVGGLVMLCAGIFLVNRYSGLVQSSIQFVLLNTPLISGLTNRYVLTVFFRTFGALVESGIPADTAYVKATNSIWSVRTRKKFASKAEALIRGEKFYSICDKSMPGFVPMLIEAGETSGTLGHSLIRVSEILDKDLEASLKQLTALVEPAMMIFMGGMVGSIAISIMMPIYEISRTLQHA